MNQSLYITTETNPQDSGGDYSIFNETRVRPKYWQDKFTRVIFSRGGLALSNISILICMLYFSYTAHPASEDVIHACDFTNSSGLLACQKAWPGLLNTQKGATDQRIATICLVGIPIFLWVTLYYTKYLSIVVRAHGTSTNTGIFCTLFGLCVFMGFIMRASYCFHDLNYTLAFCAHSEDKAFRTLNNVLIQLGLMIFSTILLVLVSDYTTSDDIRIVWRERINYVRGFLPVVMGKPVTVDDNS
jgi:hypothetical protein